jgi:hypothetical protein
MGDTPKCNVLMFRESEIKAIAYDLIVGLCKDGDLKLDIDQADLVRFAVNRFVEKLLEEG